MSSSSSSNEGRDVSDDVLLEIFLLLPVDSLIRFRFVCKYWFNLITSNIRNPKFVEMHHHNHPPSNVTTTDNLPTMFFTSIQLFQSLPDLFYSMFYSTEPFQSHNLYSFNIINASSSKNNKEAKIIEIVYPFKTPSSQLQILGSCNGLLCIKVVDYHGADHHAFKGHHWGMIDYDADEGILFLWNPSTNEFKQVPAEPIEKQEYNIEVIKVVYGFGYDRVINDYKLVRLVRFSSSYLHYNFDNVVMKVYTMGTNSWKRVDKEIPYGLEGSYSTRVGLYLNGALHWISSKDNRIYSFNIEDEKFRVLPKPTACSREMMDRAQVQVLRGCLCIFSCYTDQNYDRGFEVWMMMDYGLQESWTKLFRATNSKWTQLFYLEPLWVCKNGEVVIGNGQILILGLLVLYDPKNDKFESIGCKGIPFSKINTTVHIGSLVSLKSGTYLC